MKSGIKGFKTGGEVEVEVIRVYERVREVEAAPE